MTFFSIWVCVRVRQNQKAEAADRAAETNTIASTAESGTTSTVYAMAGHVADIFHHENDNTTKHDMTDIRMKDIKLPEYSPALDPPAYEDLTDTDQRLGQAVSAPIYESIPSLVRSDVNLVEEAPTYENMVGNTEEYDNNVAGEMTYQNIGAGAENPAYTNVPE